MNSNGSTLEWRNLALWRGERCLQTGLGGQLKAGQAITLRGPNGCGKTTLLRTLCGLSEAEEGDILWNGQALHTDRYALHRHLAYAGHRAGLKGDLSARENLLFAAQLENETPNIDQLLANLQLAVCADIPARNLSAGQKRRAALARVLGTRRQLWVLDEPFTNIDDAGRAWLSDQFNAHLDGGGMLLLAAHQETGLRPEHESILPMAAASAESLV